MNDTYGVKILKLQAWLGEQKPANGLNDLC
jgi:hypothetical protein